MRRSDPRALDRLDDFRHRKTAPVTAVGKVWLAAGGEVGEGCVVRARQITWI